jgi:hypothetical protein
LEVQSGERICYLSWRARHPLHVGSSSHARLGEQSLVPQTSEGPTDTLRVCTQVQAILLETLAGHLNLKTARMILENLIGDTPVCHKLSEFIGR